jgi:CDGSH-type Zn-finger protein
MESDGMGDSPTIECKENGPYIVKGLDGLTGPTGERIQARPVMALCRCGGSARKPFCDGTHVKNGFSGERLSDGSNDRRDTYAGKAVAIHDNRGLCAHAGVCTDRLAAVWRLGEEPWIDPDGASAEAAIEVIQACPSGALGYSVGGVEAAAPDRAPAITVSKDGPYHVTGGIALADAVQGAVGDGERYALCRCGASKNKPFCDGSHWDVGFKDPAE